MNRKTCPKERNGCGKEFIVNATNFYVSRKYLKNGDASLRYSTLCRGCHRVVERERHKKPRRAKPKYADMKSDPIVNKFLYGGAM